jgi:hypothetical protein
MRECPACKLINPDDSIACDCGYRFTATAKDDSSGSRGGMRDSIMLLLTALAAFALPCIFLAFVIDRKWISEEVSERIMRHGILVFILAVAIPAIQRAKARGKPKSRVLSPLVVIACPLVFVVLYVFIEMLIRSAR